LSMPALPLFADAEPWLFAFTVDVLPAWPVALCEAEPLAFPFPV
jgi:hypothetical protein